MAKHPNITKDIINNLYWNNNLSISKIANKLGCSTTFIFSRMNKFNIKRRNKKDSQALRSHIAPGIIDGRTLKDTFCIDCGCKVYYTSERCRKCYAKARIGKKKIKGGLANIFKFEKGGKKAKEINCPVCNNNMSRDAKTCFDCSPRKGKDGANYIDNRSFELGKCIDCGKEISKGASTRGILRCKSCANKECGLIRWKDPEYRDSQIKATFKGLNVNKNKAEARLEEILHEILPNQYKFVGDGKIFIAGFVPDFIHTSGKRKLIELFGDYWHNRSESIERDKIRLKTYSKYNYNTLVIWEHELKDISSLKNKLINF